MKPMISENKLDQTREDLGTPKRQNYIKPVLLKLGSMANLTTGASGPRCDETGPGTAGGTNDFGGRCQF